jgi:diaminopimelate decarboxylase
MEGFSYRNGALHCEEVSAVDAAQQLGTPLYLYSKAAIVGRVRELREAFSDVQPAICYSVKANSSRALLHLIGQQGAGFDIVSGGELFRVLHAGGRADIVVFAGVGKTLPEIRYALENDIWMFNIECEGELDDIARTARELGKTARVALRLNPGVAADTHQHVATGRRESKFGLAPETAEAVAQQARGMKGVELIGLHAHIGSQITDTLPHRQVLERLIEFARLLERHGIRVEYLNIGGGFGIRYKDEPVPTTRDFAEAVVPLVKECRKKLVLEPGRYIVGNSAVLLTRVIRIKRAPGGRMFVICDAGMSDLIRPALYDAYHSIWPVRAEPPAFLGGAPASPACGMAKVDVAGPICENADYLGKHRLLPQVQEGDLLAVFGAGAYAMSMSSNYNSRCRAPEALADGAALLTIRAREEYTDLVRKEQNGT